jgi:glycosyltransferase involved in cell wall biosynthesis
VEDLISVVIPTFERKGDATFELLKRALDSVLLQTYQNIEVLIVIDGISKKIRQYISEEYSSSEVSITCIESVEKVGAGTTRNIGMEKSSGKFIALLDDDDEWKPEKLKNQIIALKKLDVSNTISFTAIDVEEGGTRPREPYDSQPIGDYLFNKRFGKCRGVIQTSTLMFSKEVSNRIHFTDLLKKHQDLDFILRAEYMGMNFHYLPQPLTYYKQDALASSRVGRKVDYEFSYQWIKNNKEKVSTRAFSSFIIQTVIPQITQSDKIDKKHKNSIKKEILKDVKLKEKLRLSNAFTLLTNL